MFTNLIESQSRRREFKRRSSFFLFTVAAYAVILSGVGIGSIYAYDAQLEAQANSLEVMSWVPQVTPPAPKPIADPVRPRRPAASTAPVDRNVTQSVRTDAIARPDDPTKVPDRIGTEASRIPPVTGRFVLGDRNVDPPVASNNESSTCTNCLSTPATVVLPEKPPEPPVVKPPPTLRVPSTILSGKAESLPQPSYPKIAKDAGIHGPVSIQILVSEEGKVLSAQIVSGNPMLTFAARDAAMRARFSPTILNGQAVKIQGMITYNFTLQ
jgi:protein TonB